ncbi:MAG: family 1 glycosylhydrolase, partial [Saprospiraceae bacterium]
MKITTPFRSFLMGGFESCYTLNEQGKRLDLLCDTLHDVKCREDYHLLKEIGVYTVRESFAWHQIDKGNDVYDFSRFIPMLQTAQKEGIQVIWSLNHFDFPEDLDPFSDAIIERFAKYAVAAVQMIRKYNTGTIYLIPFNEISFVSWIGGYMGYWFPFAKRQGWELKLQIVKATIAAMQAMREVDPEIKFIHTDPIMRRLAPENASPEIMAYVNDFAQVVYQSWDMISGRLMPELGGKPEY